MRRRTTHLIAVAAATTALAAALPSGASAASRVQYGTKGADRIVVQRANAGVVRALDGNDVVIGGDRRDVLFGDNGNDTLNGGSGNDLLYGGTGDDTLDGGMGNDVIATGAGVDTVHAGAGDDRVSSSVDDGSADQIYCGDGNDHAFVRAGDVTHDCEVVTVLSGTRDRPTTIVGTEHLDVLRGSKANDTITGLAGPDVLFGHTGDDTLDGGDGNDVIWAGPGADHLLGGNGNDELHATADDAQVDVLDCGEGVDRAFIRPGDTAVNCETVTTVTVTDHREES